MSRVAELRRTTKETDIFVKLNLDGSGKYDVETGIPFLDHMLELFAKHGFFDLEIKADGDIRNINVLECKISCHLKFRIEVKNCSQRRIATFSL